LSSVIVYTGILCGFCDRAKGLLKEKNITFKEINIFEEPEKKDEMINLSGGRMTVPQIFIGNKHIGGWDDLYKLNNEGHLENILKSEGIE
tara:strand:+ start:105 stop:374 length:270 start_codon:yes stop_codon:yes gene_type:complete